MIEKHQDRSLAELVGDTDVTLAAFQRAHEAAIRLHRAYNAPMAIYKDGKVVEVSPFDLQTAEERSLQK